MWFHLAVGRWVVENGRMPQVDLFPFAGEQTPWIFTQALTSAFFYLIYDWGGYDALKIGRALFFIGILALCFDYLRRRLPFSLAACLVFVAALGLSARAYLRPDILNFLFIQIFLINLLDYENTGNRRRLFVLPFLGALWVNVHLGGVVYGGALLGAFFMAACVAGRGVQIRELAMGLAGYCAALACTPYGWQGFLYPFEVFFDPQYLDFYKISGTIAEAQPPGYIFMSGTYWYYFVLFAAGLAVLVFNKKNNFTLLLLFAGSIFMFMMMARNSGVFILTALYVIAQGAHNLGVKEMWSKWKWSRPFEKALLAGLAVMCAVWALSIAQTKGHYNGQQQLYAAVKTDPYSQGVMQFLQDNHISGPVFNTNILGGRMIWSAYPQLRPFEDGRHVDKQRFNNYNAILERPEGNWEAGHRDYGFKAVVLNSVQPTEQRLIRYLNSNPDWQLIGIKGAFMIYVENNAFDLPPQLAQFEHMVQSAPVSDQDLERIRQLMRAPHSWREFFDPQVLHVDVFKEGLVLIHWGYKGEGLRRLAQGLEISTHPFMQQLAAATLDEMEKSQP